jgi:hypothetical protein
MESLATTSDPNLCRVTLVGPAAPANKRALLRLGPWSRTEWRKLILELRIGSDRCPDWDHANLCLTAIQDLVKIRDGLMSDDVVAALRAHMEVVSYQTFRGPPRR